MNKESIAACIEPLQFASPVPGVTVFNTLRGTAIDGAPYSSLNLCDYTGDDPQHVLQSREALCQYFNIHPDQLVMPQQTHGTTVAIVDRDMMNLEPNRRMMHLSQVDALVTALPRVMIGISTADCVNMVFAAPHSGIVAVAHAGWRGTVKRIGAATVAAMHAMGAHVENIQVVMGAAICQDCFEVGDEVVQAFADEGHNVNRFTKYDRTTGKAHISLWQANRMVLEQAGILPAHIVTPDDVTEISTDNIDMGHSTSAKQVSTGTRIGIDGMGTFTTHSAATSLRSRHAQCTHCNPQRYFSARKIGVNSGRIFTAVMREPKQ